MWIRPRPTVLLSITKTRFVNIALSSHTGVILCQRIQLALLASANQIPNKKSTFASWWPTASFGSPTHLS